jgi:serine/threonine-protein kinase HipA
MRAVHRVIDELVERVDLWLPELDSLPFDVGRIGKLRRLVTYRRRRLSSRSN